MPRLLAIVIASWFMSSLVMAQPATTPQSPSAATDEVRQSFTLDGKPIPPGIFRDLGDGDMADSGSILVTVDLKSAVGSNRYYEDISRSGKWVIQKKVQKDGTNKWEETSAYDFIGSTSNNLLVVVTAFSGGGSGTFYTLHLLDLALGKALDVEGKAYDRINLTTVQDIPLGDRWQGTVTISGNFIDVLTTKEGPADTSGKTTTKRIEARRP